MHVRSSGIRTGDADFFAVMMFHNTPADIRDIFDTVIDRLVPPPPDAPPMHDREARRQRALNRIEYTLMTTFQSSCEAIGLDPPQLPGNKLETFIAFSC